jgi:glycosyltransferase involved in cell wall biosynthesis
MRVGIFLDEWRDGGVPVFLDRLEHFLSASGHEVFLFLARPHPKRDATARRLYEDMSNRLGERCVALNLDSLPRTWRLPHFQNALFSRGIACLVLNHFMHHIDLLEALASEIPLVSAAHSDADCYYYEYLLSRRFTRAHIVVSHRMLERTLLLAPPSAIGCIKLIPYGVDTSVERFRPSPEGPLRVVYSARLDPVQKRCDDLVDVWRAYLARGGRGQLSILGVGRHEAALRLGFAKELANGSVVMLGQLLAGEALDRMAEADVILNLSNFEGLPQVVLEGAVLGLYPLVSDIESGHREIVANLGAGTLCHVGDVDGFARELCSLEQNLDEVRCHRQERRGRALAHYSFDDCGRKYLAALQEVALTSPVTCKVETPRRSIGQWMDRSRRLIRYRRHFST